jgi:hypothetical protein
MNYALRMFNWQLQKPGLSAADFHVVIKVVKMLQALLSEVLIRGDVDLDFEFNLKNQDKINRLGNKVKLISNDIFEYLDACLDEFPMNFLKDFDSLLQSHLNYFNVKSEADYFSGLHQLKINSGNLFLLNLKRVLSNSFLYYKYIKSR